MHHVCFPLDVCGDDVRDSAHLWSKREERHGRRQHEEEEEKEEEGQADKQALAEGPDVITCLHVLIAISLHRTSSYFRFPLSKLLVVIALLFRLHS
mmetsp:Transcript_17303/g.20857  ORF Transcript_17303/g.20857 Transcript_17303/m.20857 type:complete len:96 (+) Transcript_17303:173-460(+)